MSQQMYSLVFPNGNIYNDGSRDKWTLGPAKAVARNVARKYKTTITLNKVEDVLDDDSTLDRIVNYVDSLKGKALTNELKHMNLPVGGDPVSSKRQRLIMHFTKYGHRAR